MPGFFIIGNPGSRRIELFQSALARLGCPSARLVAYADLLSGRQELPQVVVPDSIVRIESPGRDFQVERLLLATGADAAAKARLDYLSPSAAKTLPFDKGQILFPHQWYLGFCKAMHLIKEQLAACPEHHLMNDPDDITVMFDKPRCHERLDQANIPVPRSLNPVSSYAELVERMTEQRCYRVFVKLSYGSSASGVVAYQFNPNGQGRQRATSTVEMVRERGNLRLYNSRRLRTYQDVAEISELIDALCRHGVHVEQWLPKAGIDDHTFDLRVVVIAGQARHTVVRQSRSPMTNLHLLNARGNLGKVQGLLGAARWEAARRSCEGALAAFPKSLYAGVDLLIRSDFCRHAVLEINAFGDLLPGITHRGQDTYMAEIQAMYKNIEPL
jgi:hypothetical protein